MWAVLGAGFAVMLAPPRAAAQDEEIFEDWILLDPVEVFGARTEDRRDASTAPIATIEREEFENDANPFRVNDIVKRLPGVLTGGGPGEDKDARVYGLDKEFTRTTLNGIPIPDGGEKRELNLDRLPVGIVESVEVVRNRTADTEADGLAGVINVRTRPIPEEFQAELSGGYGGLDDFDNEAALGSVTVGDRLSEHFGLQGAFSYNRIPGTKDKVKLRADGTLAETEYEDKPVDAYDVMLDAGFFYDGGELHVEPMFLQLVEDKDKIKLKYNGAELFNGSETEAEEKTKETIGGNVRHEHAFDLDLPGSADAEWKSRIGYYSTSEDKDKDKRVFNAAGVEQLNKLELESEYKTDSILFAEGSLVFPLEYGIAQEPKTGFVVRRRERDRSRDKTVGGVASVDPKDDYYLEEMYYAAFAQNELSPADWLTLTPGVRLEYVTLDAEDGEGTSQSSDLFDVLPSLPVAARVTDEITLRASVARLVNRPKFDELSPYENDSAADKIIRGNPQLKPAKAWAFEAGVDYQTEHAFFAVNLFHREIKDVIEALPTGEIIDGKTVEQAQNVGDGYVQGLTFEQRLDLELLAVPMLEGFSIAANQTLTQSELETPDGVKRPFKDQPEFFANLTLEWSSNRLGTTISVSGNYVDAIRQLDYELDDRAEEFFLEAKITQEILPHVELFALGQNLTGENRYKVKANGETEEESTGRLFLIGMNAKF